MEPGLEWGGSGLDPYSYAIIPIIVMKVFGRMIAPRSLRKFLDESFLKRAVYIPGHSKKFNFFFATRDFRENLDRVDGIWAVFPGYRRAEIRPNEIPEMISAGATVCLSGLESAHPKVKRHLESIRRELNFPGTLKLEAYASPPGGGFGLHYDACGVTTLHLAGEKEWRYSERPFISFPEENSPNEDSPLKDEYARLIRSIPLKRVVMSPGDVLALPPGALHGARAKTLCLALNLAFCYVGAGYIDMVRYESGRRAISDDWLRQPLPRLPRKEFRRPKTEFREQTKRTIDSMIAILVEMRDSDSWIVPALRDLLK